VEDVLDSLIRRCAQQLFNLTDDVENTSYPSDIRRLRAFQDQTAIIIKAPEETKMEIPAPTEQSIEVHLKAVKGPIMVMTCEVGSGDAVTSNQRSSLFLTLKESLSPRGPLEEDWIPPPGGESGSGFISLRKSR
uniref:E2F transcription factor 6 n=1 Tax=Amphilophus citrinellus TaxID=61819 RepID=A0A3Q0QWF1_AMPCI